MLAIAYVGLIIFIVFFEISRKKFNKNLDYLTFFHVIFVLLYPMPAFFMEANFEHSVSKLLYNYELCKPNEQTAIAIFTGYFFIILGFYSQSAKNLANNILIESRSHKIVIRYAICLLIISFLSIQIYSSQYGGFLDALSKTILIRSNAVESGNLVFFKHFISTCFFASYILGSFIFFKINNEYQGFRTSIFIFSVLISIIGSFLRAGRTDLVYYIVNFFCAYTVKGRKISLFFLITILSFIILFVLYGKPFFFSLSGIPNGFDDVIEKFNGALKDPSANSEFSFFDFIGSFSYPVNSLNAALNTEYEWRLFIDWIYGVISFVPSMIFNIEKPKQVNQNNTFYLMGNVDYDIPPALLAYGIYCMSWVGLIIVCFGFGWLGRYLQTILSNHMHQIIWMPGLYIATAQVWVDFQVSGSPGTYMQTNFWYLVSIALLISFVIKFSVSPRNNHSERENVRISH
ncbi:MAG: oligosaccharide repeat unit polymerase [Stigonema ocellatum SAG 48.90 = DSM 106950]|nr:oligosaccharide repeat unit polymerase [Stigonema ocellatum SAG 48.90 = DSM 106950]